MAELLELQQRITLFHATIKDCEDKLEEKLAAVDYDESKLKSGIKSAVTRWRNKIDEVKQEITDSKAEIEKLRALKTENVESSSQSQTGGGGQVSKAVKNLTRDIEAQPKFSPSMDVSIFVRTMTMVWNTHCKNNKGIESDFVNLCEGRIDQIYRIPMQRHIDTNGAFSTWKEMKDYLVTTHRSCTTLFQELAKLNLPRRRNEAVREYAVRLKQVGDEAFTIIASKFKQTAGEEMKVPDLFELMLCDSLVRQMQADSNLREDYNQIVQHVDDCVTLSSLAQKASVISDRKVSTDVNPEAYMTSKVKESKQVDPVMEKLSAMEKKMTLLGVNLTKGNEQKPKLPKDSKPIKKYNNSYSKWKPSAEWIKSKENEPCHNFAETRTCDRPVCHFHPCNKKPNGQSMFTQRDF